MLYIILLIICFNFSSDNSYYNKFANSNYSIQKLIDDYNAIENKEENDKLLFLISVNELFDVYDVYETNKGTKEELSLLLENLILNDFNLYIKPKKCI